jgi:serine protease Do
LKPKLRNLKNKEKESTAVFEQIGMTVKDLSAKEKKDYNVENGVMITDVKDFSRAADKNLARSFIITEADRKKVTNVRELRNIIESKKGDALLLRVRDIKGNTSFVGIEIPQ